MSAAIGETYVEDLIEEGARQIEIAVKVTTQVKYGVKLCGNSIQAESPQKPLSCMEKHHPYPRRATHPLKKNTKNSLSSLSGLGCFLKKNG